jgi:hypothetical protein
MELPAWSVVVRGYPGGGAATGEPDNIPSTSFYQFHQ